MFLDKLARIFRLNVPADQKIKLAQAETEKIILAEEAMELERIKLLHRRFRGGDVEQKPENLTSFTVEETIDLGIARKDAVIWDRPFRSITITENLPGSTSLLPGWGGMLSKAYIRFNTIASPLYRVRPGKVQGVFNKIYLTNVAQSGYSFSFVINSDEQASFDMRADNLVEFLTEIWSEVKQLTPKAQATPTIYNVAITNPDQEYNQAIPVNTKAIKANLADNAAFRYAWVTGKVAAPTAPYRSMPANIPYEISGLDFAAAKTFYFADPVGTKVMTIECFV